MTSRSDETRSSPEGEPGSRNTGNADAITDYRQPDDFLHIAPWRDRWDNPMDRYAVHQSGQRPLTFRTLAEAKAWLVSEYGPMTLERREVRNGPGMVPEWWPTPKGKR